MSLTLTAVGGRSSVDEPALTVHSPDQTETRQERRACRAVPRDTPYSRVSAASDGKHHPARARQRRWPAATRPVRGQRHRRQTRPEYHPPPARHRADQTSPANRPSARRTVFRATPNSPDKDFSNGTREPGGSSFQPRAQGLGDPCIAAPLHRSSTHRQPRSSRSGRGTGPASQVSQIEHEPQPGRLGTSYANVAHTITERSP